MGEFAFIDRTTIESNKQEPLSLAKVYFLKRDFDNVIAILMPVLEDSEYSYEYKKACITNLAMAYHVRGDYELAKKYYEKCDDTIMRSINYYAFCHRYFEYKNINNNSYTGKLDRLFDHNKMNYILNVYGAETAIEFWNEKPVNVYDEQILNDIRVHQGNEIDVSEAEKLEHQYAEKCQWKKYDSLKRDNERIVIGIFVTDLQRHKDSALLYQIVEDLQKDFYIIIYFNNIFQNKLIKSFEGKVTIREVAKMHYGEIINLIHDDSVSLLIDAAEYGLRNNSIAIANSGIDRIFLSDIIGKTSLSITSNEYFPQIEEKCITNGKILILGDLRYIKNDELKKIKEEYQGFQIVFESHALDEELFVLSFSSRLKKSGFNMNKVSLQKGILPFSSYMEYIASFEKIVLLQSSSNTEYAEAIKAGNECVLLSMDDIRYRKKVNKSTIEKLIMDMAETDFKVKKRRKVIKDQVLCFYENEKFFCVNCTCNGDLLIFDDIIENRYEYFIALQ